jgi:hypothetical protein
MAPELLAAGESPAGAFAEIGLEREGERRRFRFGVTEPSLAVCRRVLTTRPFDGMPGVPYRYFYAGQGGRGGNPITHLLYVRIEQGREGSTLEFEAPRELVGVLDWFSRLPAHAAAEHLLART